VSAGYLDPPRAFNVSVPLECERLPFVARLFPTLPSTPALRRSEGLHQTNPTFDRPLFKTFGHCLCLTFPCSSFLTTIFSKFPLLPPVQFSISHLDSPTHPPASLFLLSMTFLSPRKFFGGISSRGTRPPKNFLTPSPFGVLSPCLLFPLYLREVGFFQASPVHVTWPKLFPDKLIVPRSGVGFLFFQSRSLFSGIHGPPHTLELSLLMITLFSY